MMGNFVLDIHHFLQKHSGKIMILNLQVPSPWNKVIFRGFHYQTS